ncbi:MAG: hypothetical protein HY280_07115 [Nitrospinae bacterium]|nr:hypothetical protein [Nitrospinota bacterium]
MQTLGLQTVLNMSNAVERVQQTALQHGAVVADQSKEIINRQNEEKQNEVQGLNESAVDVRIRDDLRHPPGQEREKKDSRESKAGEDKKEPEVAVLSKAMAPTQGVILDIKV